MLKLLNCFLWFNLDSNFFHLPNSWSSIDEKVVALVLADLLFVFEVATGSNVPLSFALAWKKIRIILKADKVFLPIIF